MDAVLGFMLVVVILLAFVLGGLKLSRLIARLISGPKAVSNENMSLGGLVSNIFGLKKSILIFGLKIRLVFNMVCFIICSLMLIGKDLSHFVSLSVIISDFDRMLDKSMPSLSDVPIIYFLLACYFLFALSGNVRQLTRKDDQDYSEPSSTQSQHDIIKDESRFKIKRNKESN